MKRAATFGYALALAAMALVLPGIASAQTTGGSGAGWVLLDAEATALVRSGTSAMYNLQYAQADSIFNLLVKKDPEHPAGYFLLALVDWWRIVPNADVKSKVDRISKSFNERIDKVVEISDKRLENNPNDIIGLFFKGSALGYKARLMVLTGFDVSSPLDMVNAASQGKEAYDIILQCQRLAPSNSDILLGSGLYNYFGAYLGENYPMAKAALTFLPPGDKKIGLSMLKISGQRAQYAGTEARYALLDILTNMEKDADARQQALQVAKELWEQYPGNAVFERFLGRAYYMTGDLVNADSTFTDILRKVKARQQGYEITLAWKGLYYLADLRLRSGHYDDAIAYFKEADQVAGRIGSDEAESNWNILTNLKLGYAYDKAGRRSEALRQYRKVLSMDDYNSAHDKAQRAIETPYNGNGD
jgi:tetratricopeptide (TPR) repeat protein